MRTLRTHRGIVAVTLGLIAFFLLAYVLRSIVLPFALGLLVAYLLMPIIRWVEKKSTYARGHPVLRRIVLVVVLYVLFFGLAALLSYYLITSVAGPLTDILRNAPQYTTGALLAIQQLTSSFMQVFPPEFQPQVQQFFNDAGTAVGDAIRRTFLNGLSLVPSTIGFIIGFAALPFFLFYLLKDWEKLGSDFYSALPGAIGEHTRNMVSIIESIFGRYIRAQLLLALMVGVVDLIGFLIAGVPLAPVLAFIAGVTVLIQVVGGWVGGASVVMITLVMAPDKTVWVFLVFMIAKVLEDYILAPRLQGASLRMHPVLIILLLPVGASIAGLWGVALVVPVVAIIVEVYRYVRRAAAQGMARDS